MSVNASQQELNQLIYRHLKEHGFLSAAEELQRHSPQVNTVHTDTLLRRLLTLLLQKCAKLRKNSADVAKMETINALASETQPKKKRVRKPQAKPLSKADAPVQQNGETTGQDEQGKEKVGTQTPTKRNPEKRSMKEDPEPVTSPSKQSPNKRAKSEEDKQASSELPEKVEKQTQLQETLVPVNAKDEMAHETKKKKKKKKKEKEENGDKTEGSANETNGDGKDRTQKKSEITEPEDAGKTEGAKRTTKGGQMEERGCDGENISELSLQKKKAKKKEKDKSSSEEGLAQIDTKMMAVSEENSKQPDKKTKPKKKKENDNMEGNLDYISGEKNSGEQNIEEMENAKEMVTKEKTSSEESLAEIHKKKEKKKKKKVLYNEGSSELVEEDLKANPEQIITSTDEAGGDKTCEQNDQGKKAKKRKDKSRVEENLEPETMAVEEHVEDEYNSEQVSGKKKSKKKKRESLGCKEFPEEVAQEKKAKKKNEKSDENDSVEEKPKDDNDDHTNNKSTLETDEGSLEIASPLKRKKSESQAECVYGSVQFQFVYLHLHFLSEKNKLKSDEAPEEAEISTQTASTTQSNSADVHKKVLKSLEISRLMNSKMVRLFTVESYMYSNCN
uniref:Uncharacterized protein n=1 Tax=Poecilia reticulata TaxID=8081 RepID=A0A3P9N2U2_POERE